MTKAPFASEYTNRRVALQLPLGYASGLPILLVGETLGIWMSTEGVNLKTVGAFSLVGLAYTIKLAWAPLLDRYPLPIFGRGRGRRRGWLLLFQLLLMVAISALGSATPATAPLRTAVLAAVVAFLSASQDIVVDAYKVDVLRPEERAAGVAMFTFGYRAGMFMAGAVTLVLSSRLGWARDYRMLALTMGIGVVATLLAPEPERVVAHPKSIYEAYVRPIADLVRRDGALIIIAFVFLYRFGYALATPMNGPFLIKLGFTTASIGYYRKGFGLAATLFGGLLAGPAVARLGTRRALLVFGVLLALVHLSWVGLVYTGPKTWMLVITIVVENVFIGLATTAFDAYLMALCNVKYSATQYAALTGMSSGLGKLFGGLSGVLATGLGWPLFFGLTTALTLPSLLLVRALPRLAEDSDGEKAA